MQTLRLYLLVMMLAIAGPLRAHHNDYACIARDRSVTVEGVLEDIQYQDPHVVLKVKTADSTIVTASWRTLWELSNRWGITEGILRRGDRILLRGSPLECESNSLSLIVEVRRLEDGWTWSAPSRP
jgi:hypothetical protein